jgi:hypothetical protein
MMKQILPYIHLELLIGQWIHQKTTFLSTELPREPHGRIANLSKLDLLKKFKKFKDPSSDLDSLSILGLSENGII